MAIYSVFMRANGPERFAVLFIPWILAWIFQSDALMSYWIAYLGSFLIFALTLTGFVKPIPKDRSLGEQLMRPLFILHIIFAGYMCCTSVFYLFDALGYENFVKVNNFMADKDIIAAIAVCQRFYCLAHASFASGVLAFMKYPVKKRYTIPNSAIADLIMKVALIALPAANILGALPGFSQFYAQFSSLSFIAGTLALAFAIPLKKPVNTVVCSVLYGFNFYQAVVSGFKEPIIVSIMVLGIFLYPNYKKFVILTFIPLLFLCFIILPVYVNSFRTTAWSGDVDSDQAAQQSFDAALNNKNDNWEFLVYRLSEMDMFITYIHSTPSTVPYYGIKLLKQSIIVVVPRLFWPGKPSTEELVMERVYDAGVINRLSNVSAKPAYIVDAYLSGGPIFIVIAMFAYGALAQVISIKAEGLFGGYVLGTALIFSGLFQIFWRGLSFEFIINSVFWSYASMLAIHWLMVKKNILKPVKKT